MLDAYPDIDQGTLGHHASLDKSTSGEILTRMVTRGLVDRSRDADDGRRRRLSVTPFGRLELQRHASAVVRVQEELMRPLTAGRRRQFLSTMRAVAFPD